MNAFAAVKLLFHIEQGWLRLTNSRISCRRFQGAHFTVASLFCMLGFQHQIIAGWVAIIFLLAAGDLKFKTHSASRALEG